MHGSRGILLTVIIALAFMPTLMSSASIQH